MQYTTNIRWCTIAQEKWYQYICSCSSFEEWFLCIFPWMFSQLICSRHKPIPRLISHLPLCLGSWYMQVSQMRDESPMGQMVRASVTEVLCLQCRVWHILETYANICFNVSGLDVSECERKRNKRTRMIANNLITMFSNVLVIGHALVDIIEITIPDAMYFITAADIFYMIKAINTHKC